MFDSRATTLAPRDGIDHQDWVVGALAAMFSILGAAMLVLIYLPLR